jgi:microcystin-dependent protein
MTEIDINDILPLNNYTATAGQTAFTYSFPIFENTHIKVIKVSGTTPTTLTLTTDYTVSGVGAANGGTVTLTSGATAGDRYILYRDVTNERKTSFLQGGDFKAADVNRELDLIRMELQEIERNVNRCLGLQLTDEQSSILFDLDSTADRQSKFLKFSSDGLKVEPGATAADIENAAANAAAAAAALDELTDLYLGEKASDPSLDNDGDALQTGALYFNTGSDQLKVYNGSSWVGFGANTDVLAKVSSNDTTASYLLSKIVAGAGITINEVNDGGNETLQIVNSASAFATGFMLPYFGSTAASGWLIMNGDSIGDTGSGADNEGSTYEDLFTFLWDNVGNDYAAVSSGRGASAAADWSAGKTIDVPDMRGRAFLGLGTGSGLSGNLAAGEDDGAETVTLVEANLPAHTHGAGTLVTSSAGAHTHGIDTAVPGGTGYLNRSSVGSNTVNDTFLVTNSAGNHTHVISGSTGSTGSGTAFNIMPPVRGANWIIKL